MCRQLETDKVIPRGDLAMFKIDCRFDEESGLDGIDPLGTLTFSDGEAEIAIEVTYLDSWLAGLIDALLQVNDNSHARVETEEPKPLEIEATTSGRLVISYEGRSVTAEGVKELEFALRAAAAHFLGALADVEGVSQNPTIDLIRKFSLTTPD
jgi:hypothetical protein